MLTTSGKTGEGINKARGYKETWDFYKIPDCFASSLTDPANKKKITLEKKRREVAKKAAEEEKQINFKRHTPEKILSL